MSAWTWRYEDARGEPMTGDDPATTALTGAAFPTQSDAESWLGETWHDLADAGVAAVTLLEDDAPVYGPMPLSDGS